MKYNQLTSAHRQSPKRVGRGIAAGQGKTAGRGTKGQGSRTGSSKKPGFEGGQNPLMQRLPKLHGFRSFKVPAENVYTDQLEAVGAVIDNQTVADKGLVSSPHVRVKLLHRGPVSGKVTVNLQGASATAIEAVQNAGGSFKNSPRIARPTTRKTKEEKAAKTAK
jgi:large subunit ribosomal protein L15